MKRLPIYLFLVIGSVLLLSAEGCSSDPNVEGAKLDLRNKDYARALQNLATALEKDPANAVALELKGRVLSEQAFATADVEPHIGMISEMVTAFNKATEIDPTLSETVTQSMRFAYASEFQRGVQAFNRGKKEQAEYQTAARYFESSSMIEPDSLGAYINQAYALMNGETPLEAIAPFEKSIEMGDTESNTYQFLAELYGDAGRTDDAIALLEMASEMYPEDVDLQTKLLSAYQEGGKIDRAMEVYASAVERDPENKLFRYNFGSLLVQVERYDDAIEQLQAAVNLDPEYANAQYNLGAAFINKAVDVNDRISTLDDELRATRKDLTNAQIKVKDDEINDLTDVRKELFGEAISPLEAARVLFDANGEDATAVCAALYQSYVQTNQIESAQGVAACAGFDDDSDN